MSNGMRIVIFSGVAVTGSIDEVVADAQLAEEQGFASYWCSQIFGYDAITLLAMVGRDTSTIELGTAVPEHDPPTPAARIHHRERDQPLTQPPQAQALELRPRPRPILAADDHNGPVFAAKLVVGGDLGRHG